MKNSRKLWKIRTTRSRKLPDHQKRLATAGEIRRMSVRLPSTAGEIRRMSVRLPAARRDSETGQGVWRVRRIRRARKVRDHTPCPVFFCSEGKFRQRKVLFLAKIPLARTTGAFMVLILPCASPFEKLFSEPDSQQASKGH